MTRTTLRRARLSVVVPWTLAMVLAAPGAVHAARLITGADIKDNSLTGADIKNGSIKNADIAYASLGTDVLTKSAFNSLLDVSPWERIPGGVTVTGSFFREYTGDGAGAGHVESFQLPALPSLPLIGNTAANFAPHAAATDDDANCTGSFEDPTAPAGQVCVYLYPLASGGSFNAVASSGDAGFQDMGTFMVGWQDQGASTTSVAFTWAYTGLNTLG